MGWMMIPMVTLLEAMDVCLILVVIKKKGPFRLGHVLFVRRI